MATPPKNLPGRNPTAQERARQTDREAKAIIAAEAAETRRKTERLRALRLAKEAGEGTTEIDKQPPAKKSRKTSARKTKR